MPDDFVSGKDLEVKGVKELTDTLLKLGTNVAKRALRTAVNNAAKPVTQKMAQKAPKGRRHHKTYKGRSVPRGFLSKSIKKKSRFRDGKAQVRIGVRKEAFYGINFLDEGVSVSARKGKPIKPYRVGGYRWFRRVFAQNQATMTRAIRESLERSVKREIRKAAKK